MSEPEQPLPPPGRPTDGLNRILLPLAALVVLGLAVKGWYRHDIFLLWAAAVLGAGCLGFCLLLLPRAARRLRLSRAARRLAEVWRSPADPLPGWPGLREKKDELVARRIGTLLPLGLCFTLPAFTILGLSRWLDAGGSVGEWIFLALGTVPPLLALLCGPSGWRLVASPARQDVRMTRRLVFWRRIEETASLPTVRAIRLDDGRRLVIELTRGGPWELEFPPDWPPELGRALAGRLAHLAGIEIEAGATPAEDDNAGVTGENEGGI